MTTMHERYSYAALVFLAPLLARRRIVHLSQPACDPGSVAICWAGVSRCPGPTEILRPLER